MQVGISGRELSGCHSCFFLLKQDGEHTKSIQPINQPDGQKLNFGMDFECCCCEHPMKLQ